MRKTKTFEGKRHVYDTEKSVELGHKTFGEFGDPAGYEEALYKNRSGFFFLTGKGGAESKNADGEDIKPITAKEAAAWQK